MEIKHQSMHGYELVAMRLLAMPLIGACNE